MLKKYLSFVLGALMLHASGYAPLANETSKEKIKRAMLAAEVKAGVVNLGAGVSSRVRVLLHDKTRYHGHITEITGEYFIVADAKTGATAPIAYPEVKGIKGNNLSSGAKIGIGVAIAAAVATVIVVIVGRDGRDNERAQDSPCRLSGVTTPCPPGCVCTQ